MNPGIIILPEAEVSVGYRLAYNNLVDTATITASSQETGNPVANLGDLNRQTFWKPNATGWQYAIFDAGQVVPSTIMGVLNHNLKASGIGYFQLKVGTADDGVTFDTVVTEWQPVLESSDYDKFLVHPQLSKRYRLVTVYVTSACPKIGEVFLGTFAAIKFTWPDERIEDHGVAIEETAGGYASAEQYAVAKRETIYLRAEDGNLTEDELTALKAVNAYAKDGLKPIMLIDWQVMGDEGLVTYGRLHGPLRYSREFLDANSVEWMFRQEL